MNFTISLALSCRDALVDLDALTRGAAGGGLDLSRSRALSEIFRLTSFSSSTFTTSLTFCSVLDLSVIVDLCLRLRPGRSLEPVSLKSKRWEISRCRLIDGVAHLLHVDLGDDIE